ncbi:1,4-dihydroxy-2-naphthoate octaprenyltransferase [Elizabethkingia anophelis]|uniref:1,4-dihydroxy-2-naphthoate octaprenyltransferase n=1 Tax=Elizabethkingia anophelis R26 TaxID=1246994 RepID=A0ABM6MR94_9FLAO|nr:1,4-dihydroxy-2-naphthoate octaprenyltransferase [Elizabethkingia anophelis]ATC35499.1 1,4-dihydroxy-2-naphthoate octaprenyltransferase [Elizabethkingia anophelis R26]ATC39137.1 1,4-dihydroxy-2-naphthoate octaprenyltransferase [Elizabethkingia anophelis Ag1]ATC42818.1 1,4-dihydroxy-2-naphthoate octaprenyltransferase [Elizabethkingia anophelis]ATC46494.1 1,4-dihydroxy-2-naphthoate octaprenyltransferase [Elizabethkingia anophelis]ELR78682.1 1,4-dihydroxy-2-naphthoate octaprenyltransferase [El
MIEWIKAARLRTLPLSLSGIILGSLIAKWKLNSVGESWDVWVFVLALVVTLLYQVLSNYANDYGDGVKGTDKKRAGEAEARAVASGKITAKQMRNAVILFSILSLAFTILLLYKAFFPGHIQAFYVFIGLGVACIFAAIGYTVGKRPYGYMGLGDVFVFVFFGLVSVMGSYYLFTKTFDWQMILPATAVGLFSVAVLNLNNMRDIESDAESGKHTLALKMGFKKAMIYEIILLQLPLILILTYMMVYEITSYYAYIFIILFLPLMALRRRIMETKEPKNLDPYLKQVAIMCFAMSLLTGIGLNLIK